MMFVAVIFCGSFFAVNSNSAVPQGGSTKTPQRVLESEIIDSMEEVELRRTSQVSILLFLHQQRVIIQDLAASLENILLLMERAGEFGEVKLFTLSAEAIDNIKTQFEVSKGVTKNLKQALFLLEKGEDLRKVFPLMEKVTEKLEGIVAPLREDFVKRILPAIEEEIVKIQERR